MIRADQIPPEVVEPARTALFDDKGMRGAIAAAIAAWPGAVTEARNWRTALILPLPAEKRDDT